MKQKILGKLISLGVALALLLCPSISGYADPPDAGPHDGVQSTDMVWDIQRVDAPKSFSDMSDRSLQLNAAEHPHIAYGSDHLYYVWHEDTPWHLERVDANWSVGRYTSLAPCEAGNSHISYYYDANDDLKYRYTYSVTVAPIKIGELHPFSGPLFEFGEPLHRSVLLALNHLEEAGYEVETVVTDTETSATVAVEAARRLVEVEGVHVLIGEAASGVTIPVAESVSIPSQVPQISYASSSPLITRLPADEGQDFLFRTCPSDALQGAVLAKMIIGEGLRKVSVLYVNNPYGQGLNDTFKETFEWLGGTVLASVPHDEEPAPSYTAELQQATQGEPEALVAMSYPAHATIYLREAIRGGFIDNFRFVDGTKSQEIIDAVGAEALEGMCGTAPGIADTESLRVFNAEYEAEYGEAPPLPFMPNTYDAAIVAALAAYEAQIAGEELTPIAVRNHLRSVASPPGEKVIPGVEGLGRALELLAKEEAVDYVGASGEVDFDENGDVVTPIEVWCYEGGEIVSKRLEMPFFPDLSSSAKMSGKTQVQGGDTLTYTIQIINSGRISTTFTLTDPIPSHTTYVPGSVQASGGDITDTDGITWTGTITGSTSLTATFAVAVDATLTQPTAIVNVATLTGDPTGPLTLQAAVIVNALKAFLPVVLKNG